jgi:hypothetical protein
LNPESQRNKIKYVLLLSVLKLFASPSGANMKLRVLMTALLAVFLTILAGAPGSAQDAKKDDKKEKKEDKKEGDTVGTEETVNTVDGVALRAVFYNAVNPKGGAAKAPVVVFLHSYKANPDEAAWQSTAVEIAKAGFHVLRFDFRGHGKSKDITSDLFWKAEQDQPWGRINGSTGMIKGAGKATKQSIDKADFLPGYYPMLVQDIAAIRTHIDKKNDNSLLNSSTIYLLTTGDSINLAMLFLSSEYRREAKRPNADFIDKVVYPRRQMIDEQNTAGEDIRGVIALSPSNSPGGAFTEAIMSQWVFGIRGAVRMRTNTYWQFLYGKEDTVAATKAKNIFSNVLKISDSRSKTKTKSFGPDNKELPASEQSFLEPIDKSKAFGTKLLGNKLGTEEKIIAFIKTVESERAPRERLNNRGWVKPLYIAVDQFNVLK